MLLEKASWLREFSEKQLAANLSEKSSEELLSFLEAFCEKFSEFYSYGTVLPLIGYREENPLYARTNEILKEKTRNESEKFADYLLTLTRPPKKLKNQRQALEILRLAKAVKKCGLKTQAEITASFSKELKAVCEKFKALSFDFCDSVGGGLEYYTKLVIEKVELLSEKEIEGEIVFLENYEENVQREFENACERLSLTREERSAFELLRNLGYYKWAREHEFQEAMLNIKFVQDELGRRIGLSSLESKYLIHDEYRNALKKPLEFKGLVKRRLKNCLLIVSADDRTLFLCGEDARKEYSRMKFMREKIEVKAEELRGTPACAGKTRRKVSIINTGADLHKMKSGGVLVSVATSPDLVPAMKKAIAIVTSEGGITCHAAIVSRELRIPCVVGVKNAHKILRDGEEVEVDATHGVVRKVSSRQT